MPDHVEVTVDGRVVVLDAAEVWVALLEQVVADPPSECTICLGVYDALIETLRAAA